MKLREWLKNGCDSQSCPACWEDRGYDDCDAGCYIFPEHWYCVDGKCYMPRFLAAFLARRPEYLRSHEYDGISEWYVQYEKCEEAYRKALFNAADIEDFTLAHKAYDGTLYEIERGDWGSRVWRAQSEYDDYIQSQNAQTLRQKWRELLEETARKTIMRPVRFVLSYILK